MDKTQIFWDNQAKKFDNSQKQFEQASRELISGTKDYLNPNDVVLDFGCATGTKTIALADSVKHIHGLDISAEMISEAIKKKDKVNVTNVSFSQGTIFNADLERTSFDKIVAYAIIHLLEDDEEVVQRINELLKPGGLFVSATTCFNEKMNFTTRLALTSYRIMKQLGLSPLHLNIYKKSDIEQLIRRQNFSIVKSETLFLNGMTVSFIVAEKSGQ